MPRLRLRDLNAFLAKQLHIQTVHLNYYLKTTANKNLEKHRHGKGDTHVRTIHFFRCPSAAARSHSLLRLGMGGL